MLVKFQDPDGNPLIVNTETIVMVGVLFEQAPAKVQGLNGALPRIRIHNRSVIICGGGTNAIVMGDPEDVYEKIKKWDILKAETKRPLSEAIK